MRKLTVTLFTLIISSLFLVNVSVSDFPPAPEGEYSPWGDLNDDGIINIFDIVWLASRYGTTGTPLNVTELLLEMQATIDELNATVNSLEQRVAHLEGEKRLIVQADIQDTSTLGKQVTITYPSPFAMAPYVSASVYIKTDAHAGKMAFIQTKMVATTHFTLDLQAWDGAVFQDIADAVNIQVSWVAVEV